MTQPNPSPNSFIQQSERNASRIRSPVAECLDGPAMITLKELAPLHSVKSGILQSACFLQIKKWMQIWEKVLLRTPSG